MKINTLYNENCLETMKRIPDCFVDLTVTSPPYDNLRVYKGYSFDFEAVAIQLYRITKIGGVVVWVVGDSTTNGSESLTSSKQKIFFVEQCGFKLHDTMIYAKKNFIPLSHNRYEQAWEYMFVFSKEKPKTFNGMREAAIYSGVSFNYSKKGSNTGDGGYRRGNRSVTTGTTKLLTNIFYYPTGSNKCNHPAPFPEQLAADHIYSWSNESDLVYDPFAGSGTTLKMAILQNRNWIGSEISSEYCQLINKRLQPFLEQTKLF